MRTILKACAAMMLMIGITACALLQPLGADDDARRAAKITLTAYEATQQAILIYGHLPACGSPAAVAPLCRDGSTWAKIKAAEAGATKAIAAAAPVLNGERADVGQLLAALSAIEQVKAAIGEAQRGLSGPPKPPPGAT